MSELYKELTRLLPSLKGIEFGKWYPEKQIGDGSREHPFQIPFVVYADAVEQFTKEVYRFEEEHPEYGLNRYHQILERYDIEWNDESMTNADVTKMDGQGVMALILAAIRAERFCDGALLDFLKKGCIHKWLERLMELDNES